MSTSGVSCRSPSRTIPLIESSRFALDPKATLQVESIQIIYYICVCELLGAPVCFVLGQCFSVFHPFCIVTHADSPIEICHQNGRCTRTCSACATAAHRKFPKESRGGSRPKFWKKPLHIKHLYSYYILSYNHSMYMYIYMHVIWSHMQTSNMCPIVEYVQRILKKKMNPSATASDLSLGIVVRHLRQLFIHPLTGKVHGHEVNRIGQVGDGCHLQSPEPGGWTRWEPLQCCVVACGR